MRFKSLFFVIIFAFTVCHLQAQKAFVHPGVLFTQTSLNHFYDVAQKKIKPEYESYKLLRNNPLASSSYQMRGPFKVIARDGDFKFTKKKMEDDFNAAYMNALMWSSTKEVDYAKKSLEILEGYADELQLIPATNDAPLLAGIEGLKIVTAIEILRYAYHGTTQVQIEKVSKMIKTVFLPVCEKFYMTKPYTNGNWGGIVTKMYMASAIFFDNETMYKKAVDFYLNGNDNGNIKNYVDDSTGQIQESGRDQIHTQLGIGALATVCEIAYNQGDDLYGAYNNRLLRGFEYVAQYNLGDDKMPFKVWKDVSGKYCNWSRISDINRGRWCPIYEMVYNHYVLRKGLAMPFTEKVVQKTRPEDYDGGHPGLGTFLFYNSGTGKK